MRLNIQNKLGATLLAIALPTLLVMGLLGYIYGDRAIRGLVRDSLVATNATKAQHLQSYMEGLNKSVDTLAEDPTVIAALGEFARTGPKLGEADDPGALWDYYRKNYQAEDDAAVPEPPETPFGRRLQELYVERNPFPIEDHDRLVDAGDGSAYSDVHRRLHPVLKRDRDAIGLRNVMLIDAASRRIVYTVLKQADFQISVDSKTLEGTSFKAAIDLALGGSPMVADFQRFAPAFNRPVAYRVIPIRKDGRIVGALAAQFDIDAITRIISGDGNYEAEGLGKTGETYLIGQDTRMRSDSRRLRGDLSRFVSDLRAAGVPEDGIRFVRDKRTTVLAFPIDSPAVRAISAGESGFGELESYDGREVFAAYRPLTIDGLRWGIISRRNVGETLAPLARYRSNALLAGLALLAVVALGATVLSRGFVAPIRRMGEAARRFGRGEPTLLVEEARRDDEIGDLARQFNEMVGDSERQEQIQGQIRRNIVHDLKTPVTVIKGMGETLMYPEMAEDPTWREEMVRAIVEQSDRLLDDLRDILMPIDADYRPEVETFDLSILVEKVVRSEKHTSRAADHRLVVRGTDAPLECVGDPRKLRRVMENLLSNAIKYSPGEGKRVTVELRRAGDAYEVSFADEGLGMAPEDLARVLGDGGRVNEHADMGIEGSGFGLDSVQKVLRAHGGSLRAVSTLGEGSVFTAVIPVRVGAPGATPTPPVAV